MATRIVQFETMCGAFTKRLHRLTAPLYCKRITNCQSLNLFEDSSTYYQCPIKNLNQMKEKCHRGGSL